MGRLITLALSLGLVLAVFGFPMPLVHNTPHNVDYVANRVAVISDSYTTGTDEGGLGPKNWTALAWRSLTAQRVPITPEVAAEGGAGYDTRGNRGNIFDDLAAATLKRDDVLVVFFGSRNDMNVNPAALSVLVYSTFQRVKITAPAARLLVVGPAWPTANPPGTVLRIRDTLKYQAGVAHATFVDPIAERWFVGRPELIGPDGVHPTDAGHVYLADRMAPLIGTQLLRQI